MQTPLTTAEEYLQTLTRLCALVDGQMITAEEAQTKGDLRSVAQALPPLISMVNTIGYFRGEDNQFLSGRPPEVTHYQEELRAYEKGFVDRLSSLISFIMQSDERTHYRQLLHEYYLHRFHPQGWN